MKRSDLTFAVIGVIVSMTTLALAIGLGTFLKGVLAIAVAVAILGVVVILIVERGNRLRR